MQSGAVFPVNGPRCRLAATVLEVTSVRDDYLPMEHSIWVARYLRRLRDMCLETDGAWALEHLERWMTDNVMMGRLEQDFEDPIQAAESVIYMELEVTKMTGEWQRLRTAS